MPGSRRSGGTNVALTVRKRRAGTGWVDITIARRRAGGAWVALFPHTTSISPSPVYDSALRPAVISTPATANPVDGTGPFTYAWSWQAGGAGIALTNVTLKMCDLTSSTEAGNIDITYSGTLQVVVTDTGSANFQTTTTVDVTHAHVAPL